MAVSSFSLKSRNDDMYGEGFVPFGFEDMIKVEQFPILSFTKSLQ